MSDRIWDAIIGVAFFGVGFFLQKEYGTSPTAWIANSYLALYLAGVGFLFKFAIMSDGMDEGPAENSDKNPEISLENIPEVKLEDERKKKPGEASVLEILARFVGASYMDFLKFVGSIALVVIAIGVYVLSNPNFWIPGYTGCRNNITHIKSIYLTTVMANRYATLETTLLTSGGLGRKCPEGGKYFVTQDKEGRQALACTKHGIF